MASYKVGVILKQEIIMISREFVQKYLDVKDLLECGKINDTKYTELILDLCDEYDIDPLKLAEYNMNIRPKRFDGNE
jgi:hypothetical protein